MTNLVSTQHQPGLGVPAPIGQAVLQLLEQCCPAFPSYQATTESAGSLAQPAALLQSAARTPI